MINKSVLIYFLIILQSVNVVYSQCEVELEMWKKKSYFKKLVVKENKYKEALEIFEAIKKQDSNAKVELGRLAIICYDKVANYNKAFELMDTLSSYGACGFCIKEYAEQRQFSTSIVNDSRFKILCEKYEYARYQPCEFPLFRDSLMRAIVFASNLDNKQVIFELMGYDHFYNVGEKSKIPFVDRILLSEKTIDELIERYGYPNLEMVGDPWVVFLVGGSIIHSLTPGRMENYLEKYKENIPRKDVAYLIDKIAVSKGLKQTYGTQLVSNDGNRHSYSISNIDSVNIHRMKMQLEPLEEYLMMNGVSIENSHQKN